MSPEIKPAIPVHPDFATLNGVVNWAEVERIGVVSVILYENSGQWSVYLLKHAQTERRGAAGTWGVPSETIKVKKDQADDWGVLGYELDYKARRRGFKSETGGDFSDVEVGRWGEPFFYPFNNQDGVLTPQTAVGRVQVYRVDSKLAVPTGNIGTKEVARAEFVPVETVLAGDLPLRQVPSTFDIVGTVFYGRQLRQKYGN